MINPTPKQIKNVLTCLEPTRYMRLVRVLMDLRTEKQYNSPMSVLEQLRMYIYEWLVHLGFLDSNEVEWLLNAIGVIDLLQFSQYLQTHFDVVRDTLKKPIISFTLTIIDRRYAVWQGRYNFADIKDERFVSTMHQPGQTFITGDFFAIFLSKQQWLEKLIGVKDDSEHQYNAGCTDIQTEPE